MPVAAEGINCHGNGLCAVKGIGHNNIPREFLDRLEKKPETNVYAPGQHIECLNDDFGTAICMFTQFTDKTYSIKDIKLSLWDLWQHPCEGCGSAPLIRTLKPNGQGINDISTGALTINLVELNYYKAPGISDRRRAEKWSA